MQMKEGIRGWVEVAVDAQLLKGKAYLGSSPGLCITELRLSSWNTQTPGPGQWNARSCGNPQGEHVTAAQGFFEFIQCYVHFS